MPNIKDGSVRSSRKTTRVVVGNDIHFVKFFQHGAKSYEVSVGVADENMGSGSEMAFKLQDFGSFKSCSQIQNWQPLGAICFLPFARFCFDPTCLILQHLFWPACGVDGSSRISPTGSWLPVLFVAKLGLVQRSLPQLARR